MKATIAAIPGDGIGPEVIGETIRALEKIGTLYGHTFIFTEADAGVCAIEKFGDPLPQKTVDICKGSDAVLLGAVGGALGDKRLDSLPGDKRPEKALLGLRSELSLYANLRPAYLYDALKGACPLRPDIAEGGIDIMVVRELTGGMYFGEKGRKMTDMGEAAWDTEIYSENEVRRIAKIAFDLARGRKKRLTNVDKANVMESSRLWRETVLKVADNYPDIDLDHMYADNASMQLIRDPGHFDVLLASNVFGDILSDEASQITGSIGMLPSASIGDKGPFLYEPIHGSAPDIAGQGIANPIATILSAAMMLRYSFGLTEEAAKIEKSVTKVLDMGYRTGDIYSAGMNRIGTREMGRLIISEM